MSKFLVTSSSHFTPFSYDELVKPLMYMQERHDAAQEQADTLAMQAGAIGSMLDDSSPRARKLYDDFMASADSLVDDLMKNGYNHNTANALSALRRKYGTDITKINSAITKKADAVKLYEEDIKKDKTLITDNDPRLVSLDDWLDNPYAGSYNSYSGNMLTTKGAMVGENLRRDIEENGDTWKKILGGQYFEREAFTGFRANEIEDAISGLLRGEESSNERVKVLQTAMENIYNSSGMGEWASPEQQAQAYSYIGDGIYSAIGERKSTIQQNHEYIPAYQRQLLSIKSRQAAGTGTTVTPNIASLRGNALNGISDRKQSKDFTDKSTVFDALSVINELKKSGGLRQPNGALSDAANAAVLKLQNSPYYEQLTNGRSHYLRDADLDSVLDTLGKELNGMVTNDHIYSFNVTPAAASNIAKNVFKLNIGQLSGKNGDNLAAAVAKYSDGKAVSAKDLMGLLDSNNIAIGFDAKSGNITVQRTGADSSEDNGKYNDKTVYLNTGTLLSGTSGYANAAALLYALDASLPPEVTASDRVQIQNKIAAMANSGQTIDLRDIANLIHNSYDSLVKKGDEKDKAVFNALVESFAQGLFDSSNAQWSPNNYREGWSVKTGGDYLSGDYYDDMFDDE